MSLQLFTQTIMRRLLLWGVLSTIGGVILQFTRSPFWIGVGQQAIGWGIIDALIALVAGRSASRSFSTTALRRILLINAGLDVLYILGGLTLARTKGSTDEKLRGQGWGIVLQGLFLFKFDLIHALLAPPDTPNSE
ncbi:MAG: hypothetical protein HGB05_06505 [Chloroflexi bacterium]|nr:hypothetical protein [Chloroflexota bacterium]